MAMLVYRRVFSQIFDFGKPAPWLHDDSFQWHLEMGLASNQGQWLNEKYLICIYSLFGTRKHPWNQNDDAMFDTWYMLDTIKTMILSQDS